MGCRVSGYRVWIWRVGYVDVGCGCRVCGYRVCGCGV